MHVTENDIEKLWPVLRRDSGWVGDAPELSESQIDQLLALLPDPGDRQNRRKIAFYLNNIYRQALERYAEEAEAHVKGAGQKEAARLRNELAIVESDLRETAVTFSALSSAGRWLLRERAHRHGMPPHEFDEMFRRTLSDANRLATLVSQVEIEVQRGGRKAAWRSMVRGLANVGHELGSLPLTRAYSSDRARVGTGGDYGSLLDLSRTMAATVIEGLPSELRPARKPSLSQIVRQVIDEEKADKDPQELWLISSQYRV